MLIGVEMDDRKSVKRREFEQGSYLMIIHEHY